MLQSPVLGRQAPEALSPVEDRRPASAPRARWVSPLLRRILLVNALPLALLVAALLYLDQYQNGLLQAEVLALREQARIFAGALGESAVQGTADNPKIAPDIARPLLRRLTEPTPDAQAKLYAPDGTVIADSRVQGGLGRRGFERAAAAAGGSRAGPRHGRHGLRHNPGTGAAPHTGADRGGCRAGRLGPGLATRREGRIAARQHRPEPRDAALHPSHHRQPPAGDGRRAGGARPAHRRHHPADARGARGGHQPVHRAHFDPGAVRLGARADRAAVMVPVADHRAADPAAGRVPRPRCARARGAPAACRPACCTGATRWARWPPR